MFGQFRDLLADRFVLSDFPLQEADGDARPFPDAMGRQNVNVGALVAAVEEGVGLEDALIDQRLEAEIDLAKADAELARDLALADRGVVLDQAQDAVARFVGESEGHGGIRSSGERMMPQGNGVIKSLVGSTGAVGNAHPSQIHDVPILVGNAHPPVLAANGSLQGQVAHLSFPLALHAALSD